MPDFNLPPVLLDNAMRAEMTASCRDCDKIPKVPDSGKVIPFEGKPVQIMQPPKGGKDHFYRARLLNFSPQEAQGACAALHKKKIECSVVPATPVKVAIR